MKSNKGITLVALVITVVVMLILAGVAISAIVDGNGLFSKTRQAVGEYENASKKEADQMQELINEIDEYLTGKDENEDEEGEGIPIETTVQVGDFVNYDAGTWTEADFNKITSSSGRPTVNRNTALPTTQGQFGGFIKGQSRNSNSTEYNSSNKPKYSGWRVWDINESTGEVTLISAGHPETYFHASPNYATASRNILRNRDCSMYENQYAKEDSAHILTGQEAAEWYNKQFGTNYIIVDNGTTSSTFYTKTFTTDYPIDVLENGSLYWLASPYDSDNLYYVNPGGHDVHISRYRAFGVRILVSLKSGVKVEQGTATGGVTTWNIVGN